jgi:hypothetical protein
MRALILATLIMLMPLLSACSTGLFGPQGTPVEVSIIESVTVTPSVVHPGDMVLISYRIGSTIVHDDGSGYTLAVIPAELSASAGSIVPLIETVYSPGGALPDFDVASQAFEAYSPYEFAPTDIWDAYQEPNFYMLYRAPGAPQEVEIEFWLGGGGGPGSSKSRHTLKLRVE